MGEALHVRQCLCPVLDDDQAASVLEWVALWTEEKPTGDDAVHVPQNVGMVVDVVCELQFPCDRSLLGSGAAEPEILGIETGIGIELLSDQPLASLALDDLATLRDDHDVVLAVRVDQIPRGVEGSGYSCRLHEVVSTKIGVSTVVGKCVDDDAANI